MFRRRNRHRTAGLPIDAIESYAPQDVIEQSASARASVDELIAAARADAERLVGREVVARAIEEQRVADRSGIESPDEQRLRWNREERAAARHREMEAAANALLEALRRLR